MTGIVELLTWLVSDNAEAPTFSGPEKLVVFAIFVAVSLCVWAFLSRNHRKREAQKHLQFVRDERLNNRFRSI